MLLFIFEKKSSPVRLILTLLLLSLDILRYKYSSRCLTVNVIPFPLPQKRKASRARQRKRAVIGGCPIIITFIITFSGNIWVQELCFIYISTKFQIFHSSFQRRFLGEKGHSHTVAREGGLCTAYFMLTKYLAGYLKLKYL